MDGVSAEMLVDDVEQFVVHRGGLLLRALPDRLRRAVVQMITHERASNSAQRFLHGCDLHDNLRAVAFFFHHPLEPPDLAFNAPQPLQIGGLQLGFDMNGFLSGGFGQAASSATSIYPPPLYARFGVPPS